jgi:hypothetical protein
MDHHYRVLNPWEYPPQQPHEGYEQPPPPTQPFDSHGEGTSSGGGRHSFDPYGAGTSSGGAREGFERGHRSDATGFHYTPQQYYQENMAFHQRTDNALQTLIDGQPYNTRMWEAQHQWNCNTTQTLTSIEEGQEQNARTMEEILEYLRMD